MPRAVTVHAAATSRIFRPLLATHRGADAIGKINWWWRGARRPRPVADIHTARAFLDLMTEAS